MAPAFGTGSRDIAHDKVLCIAIVSQSVPPPLSTLDANRLGRAPRRPTEVTAKVPIIAPSATMPTPNRDIFAPSLNERSYYHRGVCARSHLCWAVPSQMAPPAGPLRVGSRAGEMIEWTFRKAAIDDAQRCCGSSATHSGCLRNVRFSADSN